MRIGEEGGGGLSSCLGSGKKLLHSDFWKINKKFGCKTFVLDINFKKKIGADAHGEEKGVVTRPKEF